MPVRAAYACLITAFLLSILAGFLSRGIDPGSGTVLTWIAAIVTGLTGAVLCDRVRQTTLGNPFSRREWQLLLTIVLLDLLLVAHDLTDWRWAGTPDEAVFFSLAKSMALGKWQGFLLSEHGVFDSFPLLSSYYQSVFLRVFGVSVFGWRLSSAVALVVSLPPLYLLARELWNPRAAFMAVMLFGSAQLAVGFAHFGYNNVQVYPIITGALGIFVWSHRRHSVAGYHGFGDGTTSELLRIAETLPEECQIVYIQRWDALNGWVDTVLDEYGMIDRFTYLRQVDKNAMDSSLHCDPHSFFFLTCRSPQTSFWYASLWRNVSPTPSLDTLIWEDHGTLIISTCQTATTTTHLARRASWPQLQPEASWAGTGRWRSGREPSRPPVELPCNCSRTLPIAKRA